MLPVNVKKDYYALVASSAILLQDSAELDIRQCAYLLRQCILQSISDLMQLILEDDHGALYFLC
jgi:hypothetical protein